MSFGPTLGRVLFAIPAVLFAWALGFGQVTDQSTGRLVAVAAIEGPIGPATTHHVRKVLRTASERNAEALVLRLDTPGGLATSMREIISDILTSPVPIIGYVAPPGAHAASAGTYILYATHVAAMAPGTNLGAATPVQIGGMPGLPQPEESPPPETTPTEDDSRPTDPEIGKGSDAPPGRPLSGADAMTAKATNDAVAFIRSLAEMHGRNAEWAERAVREAASLTSGEALDRGVIDLVAADLDALLAAADGRTVTVSGKTTTLSTADAAIETIEPDVITQILAVLSNPNLAFVLMMLGVYGIIYEFINPGSLAPGVFGAICLTLGLYALNQLPLDYAGLALLILGVAFMVAEAITPTFGIFGFGGLLAFVIGSAMLIDTEVPEYQISWWLISAMTAISGAVLILLLGVTWRAYRRAPVTGRGAPTGEEGRILDWSGGTGHVWVHSERWEARSAADLSDGQLVRVSGADGLTLIVDPVDTADQDATQQQT